MELFAAATGCLDPEVASFYLERAGQDLTRAVNHFFDSPVPVASDDATLDSGGKTSSAHRANINSACAVGVGNRSTSSGCSDSTARKRQRVPGAAGQQDLLKFRHEKPLPEGACGPPSDTENLERDASLKQRAGSEESKASHRTAAASATATATAGAAAPSTGAVAPSAEWTETARRCQRYSELSLA